MTGLNQNCSDIINVNYNGANQIYTCSQPTITLSNQIIKSNVNPNPVTITFSFGANSAGICKGLDFGFGAFSPWVTIFAVLGIVIIVIIIGIVVFVVNRNNENYSVESPALNLDSKTLWAIFIGVLVTAILLIFALIIMGAVCSFT
jgi:polyferredoxin